MCRHVSGLRVSLPSRSFVAWGSLHRAPSVPRTHSRLRPGNEIQEHPTSHPSQAIHRGVTVTRRRVRSPSVEPICNPAECRERRETGRLARSLGACARARLGLVLSRRLPSPRRARISFSGPPSRLSSRSARLGRATAAICSSISRGAAVTAARRKARPLPEAQCTANPSGITAQRSNDFRAPTRTFRLAYKADDVRHSRSVL